MTKKKKGSGFQLGTILALVIMCLFLAISNKNFYSYSNLMSILKQTAFNAFLAVGMLLCLITAGIDLSVGAKVEVYNVMNSLVKAGKCVIMISSEMPEVLGMSDRVVVMRGGKVMATIDRDSKHFNQEDIMKAAWGGSLDD